MINMSSYTDFRNEELLGSCIFIYIEEPIYAMIDNPITCKTQKREVSMFQYSLGGGISVSTLDTNTNIKSMININNCHFEKGISKEVIEEFIHQCLEMIDIDSQL